MVFCRKDVIQFWDKKGNPAISDNMDGSWGHYAKWYMSDTERQTPYDTTYVWNKKGKSCAVIIEGKIVFSRR